MNVSVVVVAHNAAKTLPRTLRALQQQTYPHFEVVFVDDGSTDAPALLVSSLKDKRFRLVRNEEKQGIAKSRNVGLGQAWGELVFFTDADCLPLPNWLESGVGAFGGHDLVTGWTLYENSNPSFQDRIVHGKDAFFTCNLGVRRKAAERVGGFDPLFNLYGEDKDFCQRILKSGGSKIFCEGMIVIHQRSLRTGKDEWRRYANYYKGKLQGQLRYGESDTVWRVIRPDAYAYLFFPPLLLLTKPIRSWADLRIVPFTWLGMWRGRAAMWKEAVKARKFYF